jgi:hypothetical protein
MTSTPFDLADEFAKATITGAGFTTALWVPEFGWSPCERRQSDDDEASASDEPYPLQLLAAYQIFINLFTSQTVWVHLAAEMQAGKTGVINALFRLILANCRSIGISPNRIFTLTGMSDDDWQEQTSKRLPKLLRENVHHSGTLAKVKAKLETLAENEADKQLRNVVIALDESHHAASSSNRPNTLVYQVVAQLCPKHLWAERGIRFVTVSATDPANVLAMKGTDTSATAVVRLETTSAYQSVQSLRDSGRLIPVEKVLTETLGADILCNAVRALESVHGPLVHILRPNMRKGKDMNAVVEGLLKQRIPECVVVPWDMESKKRRYKEVSETASTNSTDINSAYLSTKPAQTTFILLKGMFRAAKTLNDAHVGVLYDRVGGADSTNLQSLLGRACGYGKSSRSIVYVANSAVTNYIELWRELCANRQFPTITDIPVVSLKGKMPGVAVKTEESRSKLVVKQARACPIGAGADIGVQVVVPRPRVVVNDDDFEDEWREFSSFEDAKKWGKNIRPKTKDANGFELSSTTGNPRVLSVNDILTLKAGKKTSAMPTDHKKKGDVRDRLFVVYSNENDPTSGRWVVHRLRRITDIV